ncbi:MAG: hypothetical protein ACP6IY_18405 [Promethearchaeia archaeon]
MINKFLDNLLIEIENVSKSKLEKYIEIKLREFLEEKKILDEI